MLIPLSCHSYYSLQYGLSSPKELAKHIDLLGLPGGALTDLNSLSGCVQFVKAMKELGKKAILGCDFEVDDDKITVIAPNHACWINLLKLMSLAQPVVKGENKVKLDFNTLATNISWQQIVIVEKAKNYSFYGTNISSNTYLGVTQTEKHEGIEGKRVAFPKIYYLHKDDAIEQRILLCNHLKATFASYKDYIIKTGEYDIEPFFLNDNYCFDSSHFECTIEEANNTFEIFNQCEEYDILNKPEIPHANNNSTKTENEQLRDLCREGWKKKIAPKAYLDKEVYTKRIKDELEIIERVNLAGYFLIVEDILRFIADNGWMAGPGRGSAAGCLISYLTNITQVDPIKYGLIFSRFYNAGRVTADKVSLPDIDIDVPKDKREQIIEYVKNKYGLDRVAQICTFTSIKGSGALKAVFRAYGGLSADEQNRITKCIPQEAKIAGHLQELKEAGEDPSIIRWALNHNTSQLSQWCFIDDDGNLQGPLAKRFEQAIRLEKIKVALSKHAAGIVIGNRPLVEYCPLIPDKNGARMAGFEMEDLESVGLMKLDILGMAVFTKIQKFIDILQEDGLDVESLCN